MPATPKSAMITRAKQKSRHARLDAKARKACVEAVWKRASAFEHAHCEICGQCVFRGEARWPELVGQVHEIRARSLGGDPHNPDECLLLCHKCHFNRPSGAHRRSEPRQV